MLEVIEDGELVSSHDIGARVGQDGDPGLGHGDLEDEVDDGVLGALGALSSNFQGVRADGLEVVVRGQGQCHGHDIGV